ncbi:MAG: benzylsuccinate synthase beta subunit family protein [Clostridia bacterium]|nr:benzylsuccinate synthase beta subunit family protein [Clostridia bacterium]
MQAKAKSRSLDIRIQPGISQSCQKCKWGIEDPTDPARGQCIGSRTKIGSIWKRMIHDYYNSTCEKFEEGEVSFRDHV